MSRVSATWENLSYIREREGERERGERRKEWEERNVYRKRDIAKAESYTVDPP